MTTDKRGDLRYAVKRLMKAIQSTQVEVTVRRQDLEVLLAANYFNEQKADPTFLRPITD